MKVKQMLPGDYRFVHNPESAKEDKPAASDNTYAQHVYCDLITVHNMRNGKNGTATCSHKLCILNKPLRDAIIDEA